LHFYAHPPGAQWLFLAGLTLLSGSFTVKVPAIRARLSISETFVFASVLLFGAEAGAVTVLIECFVISFWSRHDSVHRNLFNVTAPALAVWVAGSTFFKLLSWSVGGAVEPLASIGLENEIALADLLLPLLGFTTLYFLLNSWLVAIALGLETRNSPVQIWWQNFIWLAVNYFSGASVAIIIAIYGRGNNTVGTLAVIVPLLIVSYLTFRTAMGRVEDSNIHLSELNRLYLSTIETLAMAIDAKDQITHGHIRRVQSYAVGLAREIGISDESQIKAIEAAALLHDMGKLAVPEYILNKPGKLTGAEFEKMKLHASVGADILSAIDFPYPVVPIVRHHHENWGGGGYPDGIQGTDIPIGARILSVVDCFDALTSDRPYRPKLPDEEALKILMERRGNMYDPLVVDTFVKVYKDIAPEPGHVPLPKNALTEITTSSVNAATAVSGLARLDDIAASADEMLTLYELARALDGNANLTVTGDVIMNHLRRLIPFAQSALFVYDVQSDEVVAKHAVGDVSSSIKGLRISLGERLSGWVAANRQIILNSDPVLDLGDAARIHEPRLRSTLSAPLLIHDQLIGVLSLYASGSDAFSEDHRRIIGIVAKQIAHTFKSTAEVERLSPPDEVTGLPSLRQLERVVGIQPGDPVLPGAGVTLLVVDIVHLNEINIRYGREAGDEALRHVVKHTRASLRVADILFRYGDDEFLALLNDADLETADSIGARIRENIRVHPFDAGDELIALRVSVTAFNAAADAKSFTEHIASARQRVHAHLTVH
jgi:diguanylate cyclase (GGDEF)-like protein/putative nucleotidyltransferase with HDIG domain